MKYKTLVDSLKIKDGVTSIEGAFLPRAVYRIEWRISGTSDQGITKYWTGRTDLSTENISTKDYILYGNLYEDTVVKWIHNSISDEKMEQIKEGLRKQTIREITRQEKIPW